MAWHLTPNRLQDIIWNNYDLNADARALLIELGWIAFV